MLKPLARFNTKEEYHQLIENILEERRLQALIEEFSHYESIGIKDF